MEPVDPPGNKSLCPFCGWNPCTAFCPVPFDEFEQSELEAKLAANDPPAPGEDEGEEWKRGQAA